MNRDDYILRPSGCYDYKALTRANQQVNKIFDDLEPILEELQSYKSNVVAEFSGRSGECYEKASEILFDVICYKEPTNKFKVTIQEVKS